MNKIILAVVLMFIFVSPVLAQDGVECASDNCPNCNVKVEWDGTQYVIEYTDNSVVITGTERIVCWLAAPGHRVTRMCVKAGQNVWSWDVVADNSTTIQGGDPTLGDCWAYGLPEEHNPDISNVVACTESPTNIGLDSFAIGLADGFGLVVILGAVILLLVFIIVYVSLPGK